MVGSLMSQGNTKSLSMKFLNIKKSILVLFLVLVVVPANVFSAVLDWDDVTNTWAPTGSLTQTYNIGGSNITFTFSDPNSGLDTGGSPGAPETSIFQTGGTGETTLFIRTNFADVFNDQIIVTIDFTHPGGVSDVSFSLFDMDATSPQWIDDAVITATDGTNTFNPSLITPSSANQVIGANTVRGTAGSGNTSANGNAAFTFNQTGITQISIVYSNATATSQPPTHNQWISIHDISFDVAPTVTKAFSPDTVTVGDTSTLTINLGNNDVNAATLTANLVDNLPAGVTVASPSNIGGSCPGTVSAPVGGGTVTYTNGSTIPDGGCTITVDVTSSTVGTVTNTITANALQTDLGSNAVAASDDLTLTAVVAPTVTKSFSPDTISINGTSTLTIALENTNTLAATLTATLVDTLPTAGNGDVVVAATPNIGGTCASANVTAVSGATSVAYVNGATIPAGGCTITIDVTSGTAGIYTNTIPIGALQTDLGNNAAAASDTLTVNLTSPPTVAKSFSPNSITSGGTSQLTITLGNTNASVITLVSNMDDNLPIGVTATSINIVVNVTSNTLGVVTNTIAAGALQTDAGGNASSVTDNLTVNAGGGAPTCPAGTNLVTLGTPRNADAMVAGNPFNPNEALGVIMSVGSSTNDGNSARLINSRPTMTLDLSDTVPENGTIILSIARNNNGGNYDIDSSINLTGPFAGSITFSAGPNDLSQQINYTVPSGGARYVRFTRNSGSLWVDGVEYSQICQTPPTADLSITKDDSSLTYTPGGTGTYTIVVTNNGPDDVTSATIADNLPNGVTMTAPWTCTPSSASSSCNTPPSISDPISIDVDIVNGDTITISVPVQFSSNMGDY